MRKSGVLIGLGAVSIALVGCGGAKEAADTTTIINQTVMPSSASAAASAPSATPSASAAPAPASAAPQPAAGMPLPPVGATQLESGTENGMAKTKYSISDQLPNQVIDYYTNLLKNDGYTIITSASGADGGRTGGATAVASKNGTFVGVDADADVGEPTHFDVCQGANEMAVRDCID
jgi:hypothetical protein